MCHLAATHKAVNAMKFGGDKLVATKKAPSSLPFVTIDIDLWTHNPHSTPFLARRRKKNAFLPRFHGSMRHCELIPPLVSGRPH
jgi:hypothetical protein